MDLNQKLIELSRVIDHGNDERNPEARTWGRLAKCSEEAGEVISAYIGATGQNARKGVTHTGDDVRGELLDVAITALSAYAHMTGNLRGVDILAALDLKVSMVISRLELAQ